MTSREEMQAAHDRAASYGVHQTNPLLDPDYHSTVDHSRTYDLSDPEIVRITRLRLLTDPGCPFWDVSYCHGQHRDGRTVPVFLGASQLPRRQLKARLIELAKEAGRYAKGMGLLDDDVISGLR